jgi:hypothetical protein
VRVVTRRKVLGAGLAITSVSGAVALYSGTELSAVKDPTGLAKVGSLVLDERLGISTAWVDFLHDRKPELRVLTIGLDSFVAIELKPVLSSGHVIAGISSGATLFCLERIAWDHGYRVSRRSEHDFVATVANSPDNDATLRVLADAIISGRPDSFAAEIAPAGHAYRPSMTDDTLHAWIMQTAVTSKQRTV